MLIRISVHERVNHSVGTVSWSVLKTRVRGIHSMVYPSTPSLPCNPCKKVFLRMFFLYVCLNHAACSTNRIFEDVPRNVPTLCILAIRMGKHPQSLPGVYSLVDGNGKHPQSQHSVYLPSGWVNIHSPYRVYIRSLMETVNIHSPNIVYTCHPDG
jgi:hypothetical protein